MTTGRINQITIVRRGKTATGAASSAGEMSSSLGGVRRRAGQSTCGESRGRRASRQSAFPLVCSPAKPSTAPCPSGQACGLGLARRRTQRPPSAIAASGGRGCLPLLDGRTRQRPVIHRTHPYGGDCRGIRRLQGIPSTP